MLDKFIKHTAASMVAAGLAMVSLAQANDMEIAHTAYTAGQIDIRYAKIALEKSSNAEVIAFAETMLRDHTAVNDAALGLLNKLGASPVDNDTSRALLAQSDKKAAELESLDGSAFDKAYAENELAYHQFVNDTVENAFIPAVENAEFKELLRTALKTFKVHEGHAERMVKRVQ